MKYKGGFEGDGFLDEIKKIESLSEKLVEMGWFEDQGEHPTADMSFVELAKYHATGGGGRVIERDVLGKAFAMYPFYNDKKATKALSDFLNDPNDVDNLLDTIGEHYVGKIKALFGSVHLQPTVNNPDPLIDTGELKNKTTYRKD